MLCGGNLTVYASRRNGQLDVHHRLRGERAHRLHLNPPQIGPPFSWGDLFQEPGCAWVEEGAGTVSLHLRSESVSHPGLVVDRSITLDRSPVAEVVDTVTNGTGRPFDLNRRQFFWLRGRPAVGAKWSAPLAGGTFTDYAAPGGRGIGPVNPPDAGDQWSEGWWACAGNDGVVSAIIWGQIEVMDQDGYIDQKAGRLGPGRSVALPSLHLLVTDGNAHTARSWWQLLHGPPFGHHDVLPTQGRDPIELSLSPEPLVLSGDRADATLSLQHPGRYTLDGRICIDSGDRVRTDVKQLAVSSLTRDNPVREAVVVSRRRQRDTGAAEIGLTYDSSETVYRSRARALLLDSKASPVQIVEEDGLYTLSNGILTGRHRPGLHGCHGLSAAPRGRVPHQLLSGGRAAGLAQPVARRHSPDIRPHLGSAAQRALPRQRDPAAGHSGPGLAWGARDLQGEAGEGPAPHPVRGVSPGPRG